jgi:7-cyano-7-deazaguanine synthase
MRKKAVVLLSGGMDSATALAVAAKEKYDNYALSFDYGQRHRRELWSARKVASFFEVKEHRILTIPLGELGGSVLTDTTIPVPAGKGPWRKGARIPPTYVPARNLILLSFAAAWAETKGAEAVFIGANALDYSGYPDCRAGFLRAFEKTVRMGTKRGVAGSPLRIIAPLLHLSKADIVRLGASLGVPFHLTWSCYRGGRRPCGKCDSCLLRAKGFAEAGIEDPLEVNAGAGCRVPGAGGIRCRSSSPGPRPPAPGSRINRRRRH